MKYKDLEPKYDNFRNRLGKKGVFNKCCSFYNSVKIYVEPTPKLELDYRAEIKIQSQENAK